MVLDSFYNFGYSGFVGYGFPFIRVFVLGLPIIIRINVLGCILESPWELAYHVH